jgi:hypothetical protein
MAPILPLRASIHMSLRPSLGGDELAGDCASYATAHCATLVRALFRVDEGATPHVSHGKKPQGATGTQGE